MCGGVPFEDVRGDGAIRTPPDVAETLRQGASSEAWMQPLAVRSEVASELPTRPRAQVAYIFCPLM